MTTPSIQTCEFVNFAATGVLPVPDSGYLQGLVVNASSSGTLTLTDGRGRKVCNAMPLVAGQSVILFGARYLSGLTATIGGTADVTLMFA